MQFPVLEQTSQVHQVVAAFIEECAVGITRISNVFRNTKVVGGSVGIGKKTHSKGSG